MKRVFIMVSMIVALAACNDSSTTETVAPKQTETETTTTVENSKTNYEDSPKAAADKMAKNSVDAAHGHTH
ncbi:MAG: hypothetical protein ABIP35_09100 [Ginsengibacter sp.]